MYYDDLFVKCKFPKILSKEELHNYFEKYKNGDMDAREIIINSNIRLVISLVMNKFNNKLYEPQELVAIGLTGLIKATDNFDITRNINFSTYATKCINNEILIYIRKEKRNLNNTSLDDILSVYGNGNKFTLQDAIFDDEYNVEENYEKEEEKNIIKDIIKELSEKERNIIMLYFGFINDKMYSQREIASILNVSSSFVCKKIKKILKKLKQSLNDAEINKFKNSELNIHQKIKTKH